MVNTKTGMIESLKWKVSEVAWNGKTRDKFILRRVESRSWLRWDEVHFWKFTWNETLELVEYCPQRQTQNTESSSSINFRVRCENIENNSELPDLSFD
jgi:hypothetical protein